MVAGLAGEILSKRIWTVAKSNVFQQGAEYSQCWEVLWKVSWGLSTFQPEASGGIAGESSWCVAVCRALGRLEWHYLSGLWKKQSSAGTDVCVLAAPVPCPNKELWRFVRCHSLIWLGGQISGCRGRNRSFILAVACSGLKLDAWLKPAFVEPRAFQTAFRKGLSFPSLFQVSFW